MHLWRRNMGRTVPTFVQLIEQSAERWKKFRRALRREGQPHLLRVFFPAPWYTHPAPHLCDHKPNEGTFPSFFPEPEKTVPRLGEDFLKAEGSCVNGRR